MKFFLALFSVCLLGCSANKGNSNPLQKPRIFILDNEVLAKNKRRIKSGDATLAPAYKKLLREADSGLLEGPFSVMEKKHLPPSGDKHDYMSLAPYHWPDPTKKDGLPYMRKD